MDIQEFENTLHVKSNDELTTEILLYKQQTAQGIVEIGKRLIEMKTRLKHGEWLKWLKEKVAFSQPTASRFIKIANESSNYSTLNNLEPTKVYALLSVPAEEREEFVNGEHDVDGQKKTVDDMTTRELQKVIKEKKELEERLKNTKDELDDATKRFATMKTQTIVKDNPELIEEVNQLQYKIEELQDDIFEKNKNEKLKLEEIKSYQTKILTLNQKIDLLQRHNSELMVDDRRDHIREEMQNLEQQKAEILSRLDETEEIVNFIDNTKVFIKAQLLHIPTLSVNYQLDHDIQDELINLVKILQNYREVITQKFHLPLGGSL